MLKKHKTKEQRDAESVEKTLLEKGKKKLQNSKSSTKQRQLEEKLAETNEKLLRSLAEVQNVRRRTEKEIQDAHKYGASVLARDLLSVSDNLYTALMAISEEDKQHNEKLKNLAFGLGMVCEEFGKAFEKNGIKKITPAVGEKFDYQKHQAMAEVESVQVEKGKIVEVLSVGYTIHDRLLKPAMVNIAKATPVQKQNGDHTVLTEKVTDSS